MSKQVKDLLTLGAAALLVLTLSLWGIFKSDDAVSESERRPLKQFPRAGGALRALPVEL